VYLDVNNPDLPGYVAAANELLSTGLQLPAGAALSWAGQYSVMAETRRQLWFAVTLASILIVLLINVNTRSFSRTALVLLAVPFSAIGAIWAIYLAGYQMSAAVWVGIVALMGVDAETGVFMLMYLDDACERAGRVGLFDADRARNAVIAGASGRVRPKLMTAATLLIGLIPVMWSTGAGAEIAKRIAAPMIGGIVSSLALELLAYPPLYQHLVLRRSSTTQPRGAALSA
jgi:Cu(I)/Ag(I) efflux system membrane protein CusA/SilA